MFIALCLLVCQVINSKKEAFYSNAALMKGFTVIKPLNNEHKIQLLDNDDYNGSCGEDVYYSYHNGTLLITGFGEMTNFTEDDKPWVNPAIATLITEVIVSEGVTSIGNYGFYGCINMENISLPNTIRYIGDYAFYRCIKLTSIKIPNGVTYIGEYSFYQCSGLTNANIPPNIPYFAKYTFYYCTKLKSVTIPDSVSYVDDYAFYYCTGFSSLTIP